MFPGRHKNAAEEAVGLVERLRPAVQRRRPAWIVSVAEHQQGIYTSSSSLLLLQGLTDSLAGRKVFIELLPLTLGEYTGIQIDAFFDFPERITQALALDKTVRTFAVYGSYPEALNLSGTADRAGDALSPGRQD